MEVINGEQGAVGEEFKRLGGSAETLWMIGVSSSSVNDLARGAFEDYFDVTESLGLSGLPPGAIATPKSIVFPTFKVDSKSLHIETNSVEEQEFNLTRDYFIVLRQIAPSNLHLQICRPQKIDQKKMQISANLHTF